MEYRKNISFNTFLCSGLLFCNLSTPVFAIDTNKTLNNVINNDPFEAYNRPAFEFNNLLDKVFIRPAAVTYATFAPPLAKERISSFFVLWAYPIDVLNYAVQGNWDMSKNALLKFSVSVVITAGTSDAGQYIENPDYKPTSINKTFAHLGFEQGPYVVVPFIGNGSARNMISRLINTASSPLRLHKKHAELAYLKLAEYRANFINTDESLEGTSLDFYAVMRDITLQNERNITNNKTNSDEPININSFKFDDSSEDLNF